VQVLAPEGVSLHPGGLLQEREGEDGRRERDRKEGASEKGRKGEMGKEKGMDGLTEREVGLLENSLGIYSVLK
jgi:hypothetical protein